MKHEHALAALMDRPDQAGDVPEMLKALIGTTQVWTNNLGSTASLTFDGSGNLSGTYKSTVSGTGQSIQGPITGYYNFPVIAFSVAWPTSPPAMTSWTGEFVQQGGAFQMEMLWYLVTGSASTDPKLFWSAMNAGSDVFTTS